MAFSGLRISVFAEEELEVVFGDLEGGQQKANCVTDVIGREVDLCVEVVLDLGGLAEMVGIAGKCVMTAVADEIGVLG